MGIPLEETKWRHGAYPSFDTVTLGVLLDEIYVAEKATQVGCGLDHAGFRITFSYPPGHGEGNVYLRDDPEIAEEIARLDALDQYERVN